MVRFAPDKYSGYEGTYIGDKEDTKQFNQARKPVLSGMFRAIEDNDAVILVCPVFSEKGKFKGTLSALFRPDSLFPREFDRIARQGGMELNIMQTDGLLLYSSGDAEVGKNLFTDPMCQNATELLALGRNIVAQESGTGSYTFPSHQTGRQVKKDTA